MLSNESSANETYVSGRQVNHQYSKSTEFERDFRSYVTEYLDDGIQSVSYTHLDVYKRQKYGGPTAQALAESASRHVEMLREFDFDDIVLSVKSSDVKLMTESYRLIHEMYDYPLHLGVTEAGTARMGIIKSAAGIGSLLLDGCLLYTSGHSQGAKVFRRTVEDCRDIGIKYCTFYAFSTENWKRPKDEVDAIMKLLVKYLDDIRSMAQKNTRIIFLGDKSAFDLSLIHI